MNFSQLSDLEKRTMASLIRALVRADGTFSVDEVRALSAVVKELDAAELWSLMNDASSADMTSLSALVHAVTRPDVRMLILATLSRVAESDGVVPAERELVGWLQSVWTDAL